MAFWERGSGILRCEETLVDYYFTVGFPLSRIKKDKAGVGEIVYVKVFRSDVLHEQTNIRVAPWSSMVKLSLTKRYLL